MFDMVVSRTRGSIIAGGVISLIAGILFISQPVVAGFTICTFIGAVVLIGGIVRVVSAVLQKTEGASEIVLGVVLVLFGLLCLCRPGIVADILAVFAGLYVVLRGMASFSQGVFCVRAQVGGGIFIIIMSVLLVACGIYVMFAPFAYIMLMTGVVLVLEGVFDLVFAAVFSSRVEEAKAQLGED